MEQIARDWSAYWRGRGRDVGEAFLGEGVERDPEITKFWDEEFAQLDPSARILDIGCGAGSVLERAYLAGLSDLTGIDVSEDALALLRERIMFCHTEQCSAHELPFTEQKFDYVVSQYGFEYAPEGAINEMIRVLAPGGQLVALVHFKEGMIWEEVSQQLANSKVVDESGFLPSLRRLVQFNGAMFTDANPKDYFCAEGEFKAAMAHMELHVSSAPNSIGTLLYKGVKEFCDKANPSDLPTFISWVDEMIVDFNAYRGRMDSMLAAAKSKEQIQEIVNQLAMAGLGQVKATSFRLGNEELPCAWILRAQKNQ